MQMSMFLTARLEQPLALCFGPVLFLPAPRIYLEIQKQASDKRRLAGNLNAGIRGEHSSTAALSHTRFYSPLSSCKVTRMAHCSSVTPFFLMGEFSGPQSSDYFHIVM